VWERTSSLLTSRFVPSMLIAGVCLRFFERACGRRTAARSRTQGMNEDGEQGIWIQST
jgi:hypothetical protein